MPRLTVARIRKALFSGLVIPAHPLALTAQRKLDERRQRALSRYYLAAGAGGLAIGVHTTQFQIRDPKIGLYRPVLELGMEAIGPAQAASETGPLAIAGICGRTEQAVAEAGLAVDLGYDAGLLSLGAMASASVDELIEHCRAVAEVMPLFGFYLQPSVGGRILGFDFWCRFAGIENVVAVKIAPFNRYQTLDVVRAVATSGRATDIALYTGNDDNIVGDLLTPFRVRTAGGVVPMRIVGGLLGHWAVWTRRAVEMMTGVRLLIESGSPVPAEWLARAAEVTDSNAAVFDPSHGFAGCIPGIHEVLRRQGLLAGRWCLDPDEDLSPGQMEEIDRVCAAYPHICDDEFVAAHRDEWLA